MIVEKNRFLIKTKVFIGDFLGGKKEDAFIELREPNMTETFKLNETMKEKGFSEAFMELLPSMIVSHNLNESETVLCKTDEVVNIVCSKTQLFGYLATEYYEKIIVFISPSTQEVQEPKAAQEEKTD
jgi:hypothetical protein